ncbi:type IV pilin [Halorubrum xinjiangense]|uniref:type IV pilin n=1 Tax=Halorubrum xinjiangense TaxID=261291 RepID=UPI003C6EE744
MKPNNQSNADDRAVSPVIGVILMVAITVILAAVIGTFVLGLGDQLGDTAPQASFDIQNVDSSNITFAKTGGQAINGDDLTVSVDGTREGSAIGGGDWQSGESRNASYPSPTGDSATVRIIHDPSGNAIFEEEVDFSGV